MKFKHKPTIVDAVQLGTANLSEVRDFMKDDFLKHIVDFGGPDGTITLRNDLGESRIPVGGWIIRGVKGHYYYCSEDVFAESYEEVK